MLGADGNDPAEIAHLAQLERCVPVVRYVAAAGRGYERTTPLGRLASEQERKELRPKGIVGRSRVPPPPRNARPERTVPTGRGGQSLPDRCRRLQHGCPQTQGLGTIRQSWMEQAIASCSLENWAGEMVKEGAVPHGDSNPQPRWKASRSKPAGSRPNRCAFLSSGDRCVVVPSFSASVGNAIDQRGYWKLLLSATPSSTPRASGLQPRKSAKDAKRNIRWAFAPFRGHSEVDERTNRVWHFARLYLRGVCRKCGASGGHAAVCAHKIIMSQAYLSKGTSGAE